MRGIHEAADSTHLAVPCIRVPWQMSHKNDSSYGKTYHRKNLTTHAAAAKELHGSTNTQMLKYEDVT